MVYNLLQLFLIGILVAGGVSGSLLNPAVTVGLTAVGRLASIWAPTVPRFSSRVSTYIDAIFLAEPTCV
jgi:glycerol uptake facilitator-like aquaporin